jgi:hypothetical protein
MDDKQIKGKLEKAIWATIYNFTKEFIIDLDFDILQDHLLNILKIKFKTTILREKIIEHKIKVPASGWQQWKKDNCPEWFIKKFPVRYKEYKFEKYALYPYCKLPELKVGKCITREELYEIIE